MKYIIDAYNLIGKLSVISLSDTKKEDKLISFLKNLPSKPHDRFVCVFDGKSKSSLCMSVSDFFNIKMIFTDPEQSADSYIIDYCVKKKNKSGFIVVSSDNEIVNRVRKLRIKTFSCQEFLNYFKSFDGGKNEKDVFYNDINFWLNTFNSE